MKVKISDKEQDRVNSAKKYYTEQGLTATVENLKVGDYIFTDGKECVAFEFKTIADFITSINDNRVFNEAINQIEEFNYHYVIIYGNEQERAKQLAISKNFQEISYYQYLGAIASLNRYTTVIESYSPYIREAYYRMLITARKCLKNKPIVRKYPRKYKNPAFNYLCYCVYGLNSKRATEIVETFNLKSLNDLQGLTHEQLTKVDGIGDKLANTILKSIKGE